VYAENRAEGTLVNQEVGRVNKQPKIEEVRRMLTQHGKGKRGGERT